MTLNVKSKRIQILITDDLLLKILLFKPSDVPLSSFVRDLLYTGLNVSVFQN